MSYKVLLRDNNTREERLCFFEELDWSDGCEFLWTEGNFSCDCNRSLFFSRSSGEKDPEDTPCGEEKYTAVYAELPDGTKIPLDEDL